MTVIELDSTEENHFRETIIGSDYSNGERCQYVVKAGTWFGSFANQKSKYSFVGCTGNYIATLFGLLFSLINCI